LKASGALRNWLVWFAVLPVAAWALIRVFGLDSGFPLEAMMAFTPYALVAALLVAGVAVAAENWAASALAALATLGLAAVVLPRAVGSETVPVDGHETFTVLAANVYHGKADPEALIGLVRRLRPDVLSVEELTTPFAEALEADGIERLLPDTLAQTRAGAAGAGLYARLPLRKLPGVGEFSFRMPRIEVTLADGRRLRIVGVHPFPPQTRSATPEWEESLASLPSAGRGVPWVLAGDFNGTFDQAPFRELVGRGYRDAGEAAGEGLRPTFPRAYHAIPPITIDHVLADRRLGVVDYGVEELPGSDHRAVYAELRLP
jgi:endonuclease/exonuclease/phosphatase (EEP) superfamily protein YafD